MLSVVAITADGQCVESGVIGCEGMVGINALMGNILDQILGETENVSLPDRLNAETSEVSGFIKKLVKLHLIQ